MRISNKELKEAELDVYGTTDFDEVLGMITEENNEGGCSALCGCFVEPDGHCERHNKPSFLLALGLI